MAVRGGAPGAIGGPAMSYLVSPAAERNKVPILGVLERFLPPAGLVLEIASGTGQHIMHFARTLTALTWQPTEADGRSRAWLAAWLEREPLPNVRPPIALDVHDAEWPVDRADAIVCINMIHIAPWSATAALMRGACALLPAAGPLYLYGPFMLNGRHTAPTNEAFDEMLREEDREWGVRDLGEVTRIADEHGFELIETVDMPANNMSVVFRKR